LRGGVPPQRSWPGKEETGDVGALTILPPHTLPSYPGTKSVGGEGMGRGNGESITANAITSK